MSKDLKVGDHVKFLRSHNKAVSLTGTIVKLYDDSPVVDVKLDVITTLTGSRRRMWMM